MFCNKKVFLPTLLTAMIAGFTSMASYAQAGGTVKMTAAQKQEAKHAHPGKIENLTLKGGVTTKTIVYKPLGAQASSPQLANVVEEYATLTTSGGPCSFRMTDGIRSVISATYNNTITFGTAFPGPGTYKVTVKRAEKAPSKETPPCQGEAEVTVIVIPPPAN